MATFHLPTSPAARLHLLLAAQPLSLPSTLFSIADKQEGGIIVWQAAAAATSVDAGSLGVIAS